MTRALGRWALACLLASSLAACDAPGERPRRDGGGDAEVPLADEDGDSISDFDEGRASERDTDGDGTPDYLDDDSDGDGIPDAEEAGDDNPASAPIDSDGDGQPDFVDTDSDDNGILDADETPGDIDGDGRPNYADPDDDGDLLSDVRELRGMVSPPADSDGDGLPDYHDPDSDADTINDGHDGDVDTDMDGTPDFLDTDSDDDGIPDATEAGDTDLATPPVDTDADTIPDFRDPDSDGDGLGDREEVAEHGTSPTAADTDGDGVSDLIEVAAGSDPTNMDDSPLTRGDFVFVVPYMEPPDPTRDTLSFRTSIQFADIYFLFDRTTSMNAEIDALRGAVTTVIGNLTCADTGTACMSDDMCGAGQICSPFSLTCIEDPGASSCVPSMWTGTGWYEVNLNNLLSLQPNPAVTSTALGFSTSGGTENLYRSLRQLVDGSGASGCASPLPAERIGCPAFRDEAVRVVVVFTDEDSDSGTLAEAAGALSGAGITMIGVWSGLASSMARNAVVNVVRDSGSLDRMGNPLVFNGVDAAVVPVVTTAITEIVEGVPLRVTIEATDEPGDAGDSLQFIRHLETNTTAPDCAMAATEDTDSDGFPDAFPMVTPGTRVCWDVVPEMNTTVMPTTSPQIFRALLTVRGDGSPLDSRQVFFLVPPSPPVIGGPE